MPVVAETYDGLLSDMNGQHVTAAHARAALDAAATGPLAEGNVGGGTGMVCYEFKGGTGTASRRAAIGGETFMIGAIVQANHGMRDWLTILGVPVGREMREDLLFGRETGSIIVVLGTDAPLSALSLRHVARRAAIGIGRGGAVGGNSSGDIFLAFSVANPCPMPQLMKARVSFDVLNNEQLDPLYLAAVESVEEAVVNAMVAAELDDDRPAAGKALPRHRPRQALRNHAEVWTAVATQGPVAAQAAALPCVKHGTQVRGHGKKVLCVSTGQPRLAVKLRARSADKGGGCCEPFETPLRMGARVASHPFPNREQRHLLPKREAVCLRTSLGASLVARFLHDLVRAAGCFAGHRQRPSLEAVREIDECVDAFCEP